MKATNFSFKDNILTTDIFSKELDFPIQKVLFIESKQSFIVLFDRDSNLRKWGQFPNIICLSSTGDKLWTAELPTTDTGDSYSQIEFKNQKFLAYSWRSFTCEINLDNGKIVERIFTK